MILQISNDNHDLDCLLFGHSIHGRKRTEGYTFNKEMKKKNKFKKPFLASMDLSAKFTSNPDQIWSRIRTIAWKMVAREKRDN